MLTQHYHIIDSEEYPDIREVEVYVNGAYFIEIKDVAPDDEYPNGIVLTPEMAKDLVDVLQNMLKEDNDQQPKKDMVWPESEA